MKRIRYGNQVVWKFFDYVESMKFNSFKLWYQNNALKKYSPVQPHLFLTLLNILHYILERKMMSINKGCRGLVDFQSIWWIHQGRRERMRMVKTPARAVALPINRPMEGSLAP